MSSRQDRADRLLIVLALVILFMAGAAFYFDGWMWGGKRDRGERIGLISGKNGDVRVKFEGDLKWGKAARGQDLAYNDSIYAGSESQADLSLGQSKMTVQENTLVVLRREKEVNFLNLNYGSLFGNVAKNEKIMIDTGAGKPIEFTTNTASQIVLKKTKSGQTELNVISGSAEVVIDGKKQRVDNSAKIILDSPAASGKPALAPQPKVETVRLNAVQPLKEDFTYADQPMDIPFRWQWSNQRPAREDDKFTLEFAVEPAFQKIHATKVVVGKAETTMHASKSLGLFYRVRGPRGELSQVEKVNFVRTSAPVIVKPIANEEYVTPENQSALVEFEFDRGAAAANVNYQVATDSDFSEILLNQTISDSRNRQEIAAGQYFVRARNVYAGNRTSAWSPNLAFRINPRLENFRLTQLPPTNRVVIPNRPYPASLYKASPAKVSEYLNNKGLLANHFPIKAGDFDELKIKFDGDGASVSQNKPNWPVTKLAPGRYSYNYQALKKGFKPSPVSPAHKMEIAMEPPRSLGPATFGDALEDGSREAVFKFTPLLFAKTYDVEVSSRSDFANSKQLRVDAPVVQAQLAAGSYYWRARARDSQGRIISDFSAQEKLEVPQTVPASLAANGKANREPAATDTSTMKVDTTPAEAWVRNGWWAWGGTGYAAMDVRQSVPGRGTLTSFGSYMGGKYFEGGYNNSQGWGGVVSYKSTPGKIETTNATVDTTAFTWSTVGVEGYKRQLMYVPWTSIPMVFGARFGIQQHKTPFVFLDADTNLRLKENRMDTASFGLMAEYQRRNWTLYWMSRYQYPFQNTAEGSNQFTVKPIFAFDGSVGASYNLTRQLKLGLFWYGQWHQYNFVYGDADVTNVGFQSLFYSNFDLRLGFEF